AAPAQPEGLERIRHIVVIVLENHSFDSLYGRFPGANGLAQAGPDTSMQGDLDGRLYETLPEVKGDGGKPDLRFPGDLPNEPFDIGAFASASQKIPNLTHRFYLHQEQIDGGRMDHYAALSEVGGLVMGHYDAGLSPMGAFARQYTVADNFFQAAFGGSFLNHQWLVCACTPRYEGAPAELKTQLDANGKAVKERALTPDGYAVNTLQPFAAPFDAKAADPALRLPPQLQPTIGDRLSAKNVSWAWYSGGWNDAVAGHPDPSFQFHHQPFAYYKNYGPGSKGRAEHLKDATDFLRGVERGSLPAVAFYKPIGSLNEHPGYADLLSGERHVADVIEKIQDSPLWGNTAIIVTYDEYGGFWDHVPPPEGDRWGPGTRVPTLIISPYARHGHVDHTLYDATSILKFIETRFGLQPLGPRDEKAGDLLNAFDFRP
ncbi:alkaline phosphatase family protein, partial [Methylogaea oryzae]